MESIQQIAENFINKMIEVDMCEGVSGSLEKMKDIADEAICRISEQKLQEMDLIWFFFGEIKEIEVKVSAFDFCVSTYVFVCFVS